MCQQTYSEDWLLSELLLNKGYTKNQLAACLSVPVKIIDSFLSYGSRKTLNKEFKTKLAKLYIKNNCH